MRIVLGLLALPLAIALFAVAYDFMKQENRRDPLAWCGAVLITICGLIVVYASIGMMVST